MFEAKLNEVAIPRKRFLTDPINFAGLGPALLINIIHWAILYFKIKLSSGTLLLHYNVIYGPDVVGRAIYAYVVPLSAFCLLVANIMLAVYLYRREKLAAYFLNFAGIVVQIVFLAATLMILQINA